MPPKAASISLIFNFLYLILFLYGPDTYRAKINTDKLVARYKTKYALADFAVFDFSDADALENLAGFTETPSLFAEKKLAVVKNPITRAAAHPTVRDFFDNTSLVTRKDVILILIDACDKIPAAWRTVLEKAAQSHKFELLQKDRLARWIRDEASHVAITLEPGLVKKISEKFESDTWSIHNEIVKLSLLGKKCVGIRDAETLTALDDADLFSFLDSIWQRSNTSLSLLEHNLAHGLDASTAFYALAKQSSALQLVVNGFSKDADAHPFVIKKLSRFAKKISPAEAAAFHAQLADYDINIKQGNLDYELALTGIAATPLLSL